MERTSCKASISAPLLEQRNKDSLALRTLYSTPLPAADWAEDYEERASQWWELFVDLILVIAFTNVADALYESDESVEALFVFVVTFNLIQAAWLIYAQHNARFIDDSLLHSAMLFVMMLGLAGMAIHVGEAEFTTEFTASMLLVKAANILMYSSAMYHSPRSRRHMACILAVLGMTSVLCLAIIVQRPRVYTPFTLIAWTAIVALELPADVFPALVLDRKLVLPINIDHFTDRLNSFIMVALGESLLSAMIKYGTLPKQARTQEFYVSMSLVLLMAFSISLLYYNVQPIREESAFRKSRIRGHLAHAITSALATVILLVGTGVKHVMYAVISTDGLLRSQHVWLLYGGVSLALHLIFWLRITHYWGSQPAPFDPPRVRRIKFGWWVLVAGWPFVMLGLGFMSTRQPVESAIWTLAGSAGACAACAMIETLITHWLSVLRRSHLT